MPEVCLWEFLVRSSCFCSQVFVDKRFPQIITIEHMFPNIGAFLHGMLMIRGWGCLSLGGRDEEVRTNKIHLKPVQGQAGCSFRDSGARDSPPGGPMKDPSIW